jgi:hypothetical protein
MCRALLVALLLLLLLRTGHGAAAARGMGDDAAGGGLRAPALAGANALHPMPAAVPCGACGRPMMRKNGRRTGRAFYGCSGFARHRCRFVRSAAQQAAGRPAAAKYLIKVLAEMETPDSFRLTADPRGALAGLLGDVLGVGRPDGGGGGGGERAAHANVSALGEDVACRWTTREDGLGGAVLPLNAYASMRQRLLRLPALSFEGIPSATLRAFAHAPEAAAGEAALASSGDVCRRLLPPLMQRCLSPYQRQGIEFVLSHGGRALIADEMGLGTSAPHACLPSRVHPTTPFRPGRTRARPVFATRSPL